MKPISALTQTGRLRRQYKLAQAGLAHYEMGDRDVRLVSAETNFIYRVTTRAGERFALRLTAPHWRSEANLRAEVAWLDALASGSSLAVPRVVRTRAGEGYVSLPREPGGAERRVLVTSWQPGVSLGKRLTTENLGKLGQLFADLHQHGKTMTLRDPGCTEPFPDARMTSWLSRGEPDALFAGEAPCLDLLDQRDAALLEGVKLRVDAAYAALDPADLRVIHGDLWHENVRVHRGVLRPFDFEDTILGYRLHDVAMALLDLEDDVDASRYAALHAAFVAGYESVMPWPQGDFKGMQAGRKLWVLNWLARVLPARFTVAARSHIAWLRAPAVAGSG